MPRTDKTDKTDKPAKTDTRRDLKRELKHLYHARKGVVVQVDVPPIRYLMIDGEGDPTTSAHYARAVEALFSVSYAARFMLKKGPTGIDYAVMPLEGLWWADDMSSFAGNDRSKWQWTMMIHQPPFVDASLLHDAMADVKRKKGLDTVDALRIERFTEGTCAQTLHVGPFSEEGPTIGRVHDFIEAHGRLAGKHHEIYLSDIRRAAPSRWKTIIRQPMA